MVQDTNRDIQEESSNHVWRVYVDGEFDAIRMNHKFQQAVVSIGAVLVDAQGSVQDRFYETIYPIGFQHLTRVVSRMTKLQDEQIRSSNRLQVVMQHVKDWCDSYDTSYTNMRFYSFGPDDKRTIQMHCQLENVEVYPPITKMVDLQRVLSASVMHQEHIVSTTLSLDDLKLVYGIKGEVEHNALNDAMDLMHVHQAFLQHKQQDEESIAAIVSRKAKKEFLAKEKQQHHFCQILRKNFANVGKESTICFYPEVIELLRNWGMRDAHFRMRFKKDHMEFNEKKYAYAQLHMHIHVFLDERYPYVIVSLCYEQMQEEYKYVLTYRNASSIEGILRRCGKEDAKYE